MLTVEWNLEDAQKVWLEEGIEKGLEQGVDLSAEIIRALMKQVPTKDIAAQYHVPMSNVERLQAALSV